MTVLLSKMVMMMMMVGITDSNDHISNIRGGWNIVLPFNFV